MKFPFFFRIEPSAWEKSSELIRKDLLCAVQDPKERPFLTDFLGPKVPIEPAFAFA